MCNLPNKILYKYLVTFLHSNNLKEREKEKKKKKRNPLLSLNYE